MSSSRRRRPSRRNNLKRWLVIILILLIVGTGVVFFRYFSWQISATGRLVGKLTDREGNPLGNLTVSIRNGPQANTDTQGNFVLNPVPAGDQFIIITPPGGSGQLTQHISISGEQTTTSNIVYDLRTSRLGLLSIYSPVDGALLDVRRDGDEHRATVYGRCDGLAQIFDRFDVCVITKSEHDLRYWLQRPPALIDPSSNTWHADIIMGSPTYPPRDGERWDIIAVAADSNLEIDHIINTPNLNKLPPHTSSNVVTVQTRLPR